MRTMTSSLETVKERSGGRLLRTFKACWAWFGNEDDAGCSLVPNGTPVSRVRVAKPAEE